MCVGTVHLSLRNDENEKTFRIYYSICNIIEINLFSTGKFYKDISF